MHDARVRGAVLHQEHLALTGGALPGSVDRSGNGLRHESARLLVKRGERIRQTDPGEPEISDRMHQFDELVPLSRLDEVTVGVQLVAPVAIRVGLRGRQDHDGNPFQGRVALHFGQHLATVLLRQVEVQQDQIGPGSLGILPLAAQEGHRLHAVRGPVQPVVEAALSQGLGRQARVGRIVLHQENVHGTLPAALSHRVFT